MRGHESSQRPCLSRLLSPDTARALGFDPGATMIFDLRIVNPRAYLLRLKDAV